MRMSILPFKEWSCILCTIFFDLTTSHFPHVSYPVNKIFIFSMDYFQFILFKYSFLIRLVNSYLRLSLIISYLTSNSRYFFNRNIQFLTLHNSFNKHQKIFTTPYYRMGECPHFPVKKNEINPELYLEHHINKSPKIAIDKIN